MTGAMNAPMRLVVLLSPPAPAGGGDDSARAIADSALHAALALRTASPCRITALAVGSLTDQRAALVAALHAGCEHAVCVSFGELGETDGDDSSPPELTQMGVAEIVRASLTRLGCDVLLCNDRPHDPARGALGPMVAELLGVPHVTGVVALELEGDDGDRCLFVEQRGDRALHQFRCPIPVVLGVRAHPGPAEASAPPPGADDIEHLHAEDLSVDMQLLGTQTAFDAGQRDPAKQVCILENPGELIARLFQDRLLP